MAKQVIPQAISRLKRHRCHLNHQKQIMAPQMKPGSIQR